MKAHKNQNHLQAGGILLKLLLWIGILFLLGAIAWKLFLPTLVVSQIQSKTGFIVRVDQLAVNPFTANVALKGLVLKNPAGWPVQDFVDLREFKAEANLKSFFSDRMVANEVVLDIGRFTLVKNQQGVYNAKVFADALSGTAKPDQPKTESPKKGFLIKHLVLKLDDLVYVDNSTGKPTTKEYNLKFNRELNDVDSVAKIINPIANVSLGALTDALSGVLNGRTDLLKDAAGAIQGAGKKTGEKLKSLLDSLDKKKP